MKKYLFVFVACFMVGFFVHVTFAPPAVWMISPCRDKNLFDIFDRRPVEQRYVVIDFSGRLGNQMFQYAAAYAYGKEQGKTVVVNGDAGPLVRAFGLNLIRFNKNDACFFPAMPSARRKEIAAKAHMGREARDFLNNPDIIFLRGLFQNEQFFRKYAADIRKLYTFQGQMPIETEKLKTVIESQNAVSIHVRRTDYVNRDYYFLTGGYYKRAMKYIAARVENPHFYIFSDDIDWVERNMEFKYPHTFVKVNENHESYFDMWLMSLCKHNIIAHSTFAWWGAWLNKNPDKIVIAPDVWGANSASYEQTKELVKQRVPPEWVIISNVPKGEED